MTDEEFYEAMAIKHDYLNQKEFDLCYNYAWQLGHAYGHSEVEAKFLDVVEFAEKFVDAYNSTPINLKEPQNATNTNP